MPGLGLGLTDADGEILGDTDELGLRLALGDLLALGLILAEGEMEALGLIDAEGELPPPTAPGYDASLITTESKYISVVVFGVIEPIRYLANEP